MTDDPAQPMTDEPDWPLRAVILMAVGAAAALMIQQLMDVGDWERNLGAGRDAWATGIGVGALAFGFGLSRVRIAWTVMFSTVLGVVAGLIVWLNSQPDGVWTWSGASMVLAIAIAVPLFQVARDEGRASFPYTQVHGHAWTNVVLWGACWGFTGIVVLLSHLLGELFALIGIDVLKDLLNKSWSNALIIGAAFGAALALLRDRDRVVRLLQRVVTSVLSVLAPVLGIALILFIASLPFTGLNSLWEATKSTTPILMACVIGALILANAVIGHGPEDEARNPVLRWSALALGVSILPLAVIAALAMGLRLNQYGLTPDRLWGLVCVVFAVGYGLVYFVAVVRKRLDWAPLIRRDNIRLAFATMAVALLLATPLVGFNAISVNDQVARLKSGKVGIDKFDWAALAFDFGEPGKRALADLKRSTNSTIAVRAKKVAEANSRWDVVDSDQKRQDSADLDKFLTILPEQVELPAELRIKLVDLAGNCGKESRCYLFWAQGDRSAVFANPSGGVEGRADVYRFQIGNNGWERDEYQDPNAGLSGDQARAAIKARTSALKDGFKNGEVEIRTVKRRQVYVGGQPVGAVFE